MPVESILACVVEEGTTVQASGAISPEFSGFFVANARAEARPRAGAGIDIDFAGTPPPTGRIVAVSGIWNRGGIRAATWTAQVTRQMWISNDHGIPYRTASDDRAASAVADLGRRAGTQLSGIGTVGGALVVDLTRITADFARWALAQAPEIQWSINVGVYPSDLPWRGRLRGPQRRARVAEGGSP